MSEHGIFRTRMIFRHPANQMPLAIAYQLENIPGIPDYETTLIAGIRSASGSSAFNRIPEEETEVSLNAIAQTYGRSRYHKLRFDDGIQKYLSRRETLGGPNVADWHAVPPILNEAMAFLGSARTIVDLLVYLAARRSGESESKANRWKASQAINPQPKNGQLPPPKYDVPEVLEIRKRDPWFQELNVYRNVVFHRGWTENFTGLYLKSDIAEEASDPEYNVMLLPDYACLRSGRRPHQWTYADGTRLDELVSRLDATLEELLKEILVSIWHCAIPAPGTAPREEHPNTILSLPIPVALSVQDKLIVPIFDSQEAAEKFSLYGDFKKKLTLREVRPTKLNLEKSAFLLSIPTPPASMKSSHTLCMYQLHNNELVSGELLNFDPVADCVEKDMEGIVPIASLDESLSAIYIWQQRREKS